MKETQVESTAKTESAGIDLAAPESNRVSRLSARLRRLVAILVLALSLSGIAAVTVTPAASAALAMGTVSACFEETSGHQGRNTGLSTYFNPTKVSVTRY